LTENVAKTPKLKLLEGGRGKSALKNTPVVKFHRLDEEVAARNRAINMLKMTLKGVRQGHIKGVGVFIVLRGEQDVNSAVEPNGSSLFALNAAADDIKHKIWSAIYDG